MGYSLIAVVIVNMAVNLAIIIVQTAKTLWLYTKLFCKKFKAFRERMRRDTEVEA